MMRLTIRERVRRKALPAMAAVVFCGHAQQSSEVCYVLLYHDGGTEYELDLPPTFRVTQSEMKEGRLRLGIQLGTNPQMRTCADQTEGLRAGSRIPHKIQSSAKPHAVLRS